MKPMRKLLWSVVVLLAIVLAIVVGFWVRPVSYFNRILYMEMAASGAHSRWITVDGIRLHYYEQGPADGPAVLLIHGLGGHAEDWRNLAPFLWHTGFHVFTPDLPGYGRSAQPKDFSYSIADEAKVVVDFMEATGLKKVDLGGWSMGGWIVQRIAYEHPDRIHKLMLFDSAGLYDRPTWNTALFTPTSVEELDQLDALLMPNPPQVPPFIARDILRQSRAKAWVVQRAMASMLTGKDVTDTMLPQLKMPVLIVWGALDHITPLSQGEKMHQLIPQSRLEVVPGCGHLAPVQCADRMGPKVLAFLQSR